MQESGVMATYASHIEPEKARLLKLVRTRVTVAACVILFIDFALIHHYPWTSIHGAVNRLLEIGLIVPTVVLIQMWFPWWTIFRKVSKSSSGSYSITISADSVSLHSGEFERQLSISEILRAEEPKWGVGIYLRTANRYRWLLIRKTLEGYPDARRELESLGISFVRTRISPNWEEFLGALAFCASLLCDIVISDRSILLGNLAVAVALAVGGMQIAKANSEDKRMRRRIQIGSWIPAIFAAAALYFAR